MPLDRRLGALEQSLRSGEPCAECGFRGAPGDPPESYEIIWEDEEGGEDPEPEYCGACGRRTEYVITWGDLEEAETDITPGGGR